MAVHYFSSSALNGNPYAQEIIGYFYLSGTTVLNRDISLAFYWYSQSAKQNNYSAQYMAIYALS